VTDSIRQTLQTSLGAGYRIERELGGGGMSRVFVARDLSLDRDVVVKVLPPESTEGVSGDRFRREIQLIARLQHPHVVPIISAGAADGVLYYVMPFVGGESMRARLSREGPLPVADAARILREVLDALAFAHRLGVIHRDIKPENVLLEAGHAVMADFGIAKALRESGTMTSVGTAVGTPAYMAPEQATADPTADHRADLYAVGVLGFELLTGTPPFTGSAQQLIVAHLTQPAPPLRERRSDVPQALADLIARALAKDPAERPQSAQEMIAALDAAITPVAITPTGALPGSADAAATFAATLAKGHAAKVSTAASPIAISPAAVFRQLRNRLFSGAGAVFMLGVVGFGVYAIRRDTPMVVAGAELIAVMPLAAVSDSSLARLGQDLVVTLSTNFDGVGDLRTVDAVTLLMRARDLPSPIPIADARKLARELGARSVLTGTLIAEGDRVRASVVLQSVSGDSTMAKATALAAPREIAALTDSLTWEVLRQVWRRGTSPSPVLSGLTTRSFDALRAFLDGERHFLKLEITEAMADYRTAFELDSNFVQALLRYDYVREWSLRAPDEPVRARLLASAERLPERERSWLEVREGAGAMPIPQRVAAWKALAAKYPEYPPALMSAADVIIHSGPVYGIAIEDAQPFLDRLDELVPDHADTKFHQAMVSLAHGTPEEILRRFDVVAATAGPPWGPVFVADAAALRAQLKGEPMPAIAITEPAARAALAMMRENPALLPVVGSLSMPVVPAARRLDALAHAKRTGIFSGEVAAATAVGEGNLRIGRGEWAEGLRALRTVESSDLATDSRQNGARLAVLGAWLGAVDPAVADSTQRRAHARLDAGSPRADRIESLWREGVMGVLQNDQPRLQSAATALRADTSRVARYAARSLEAVRLDRAGSPAAADSALAVSDDTMRDGGFLLTHQVLDRLIAARGLRRSGAPARAERYLMWTDAALNSGRSSSLAQSLYALNGYERGIALEEAGDRYGALLQLHRFVDGYTMPPEAHRALVDDAKRRISLIEAGNR
jgi:serine/threonine-protein kinase